MEDKRITKTKKNLKYTLVDMLAEQPFEKITITELCSRTEISRITFYSHYSCLLYTSPSPRDTR